MTDLLLTWGCSYLLHSSLLIGGLWAAERAGWLARLGTATQEVLWRLALLGGLLSASLPGLMAPTRGLPVSPPAVPAVAVIADAPVMQVVGVRPALVAAPAEAEVASARRPTAQLAGWPVAARLAPLAQDAAVALVTVWLAGALLMTAVLALQWAWLRRTVRRLPVVQDARWRALTAVQAAELGVPVPALRQARPGWASPLLAPGRVLCLPAWCLALPDDEAAAVLGHELAHVRRRDPAWRLAAALLQAMLWPQALNRVALRRLDLLAELACDAAAAAPQGRRLALAQSLLRCAEALQAQGRRAAPALACGAAGERSPLLARVRRLVAGEDDAPTRERPGLRWLLLGGMLGVLIALPAVVVSHTQGRSLAERLNLDGVADALDFNGLHISGGTQRIISRYPGGSFSVKLQGQVGFSEAEDEIQTLQGELRVREREGSLTREMKLVSTGEGRIEREYRVGGEPATLDDAGRRWWAQVVQRMAEQLTPPEVRAKKLFDQGGLDAVLADLDKARDDFSRRRRIHAAVGLHAPWTEAALGRLIAAAGPLQGSFDRREALASIASLPLPESQQRAWLQAAAGIDGDFDRREALGALARQLSDQPAVLQAWSEAVSRIGGDFDRRGAIEAQVSATPVPAVLAAGLQAAAAIQGDFDKREALAAIARQMQGDEVALVEAYARATSGMSGGFDRREALNLLLDRPRLGAAGVGQVITSAEGMEAGFERLQVLLHAAERLGSSRPVEAGVVERLRRAGRGLGDFERGQLENALDRLG